MINFNSPNAGYLFRQLYIRQALQDLVDQPQDVKFAYHGNATASYGPVPLAPSSPFTTSYERSNPYPFSVADAGSLLRSHGWAVHSGGTDTCAKSATGPRLRRRDPGRQGAQASRSSTPAATRLPGHDGELPV